MRTIYWVALIGSIAAAAIACSSEDDGNDPIGPSKGGAAGGPIGKGGAAGKGGGTTNNGGSSNEGGTTNNGGTSNEGGTAQGGAAQGGAAGSGPCDPETKSGSDECSSCYGDAFQGACATQLGACEADTDCNTLLTCIQGCQDQACQTACFDATSSAKFWAWYGCADATCHSECYCTDCGFFIPGECTDCAEGASGCMAECSACVKDTTCNGLVWCLYGGCDSADTACQNACQTEATLSSAVPTLGAFLGDTGCVATKCKAQCFQ